MTELDIKDLILKRMSDLMPNATSFDLSYMACTLKNLETLGKPDSTDKYLTSLTDMMKIINDRKVEDDEQIKKMIDKLNKSKEVKEDERV